MSKAVALKHNWCCAAAGARLRLHEQRGAGTELLVECPKCTLRGWVVRSNVSYVWPDFEEQTAPLKNDSAAVWSLVIRDMADRDAMGLKKYGTRLQPNNGRNALQDAYEEALDLAVYLRQAIYERDGK